MRLGLTRAGRYGAVLVVAGLAASLFASPAAARIDFPLTPAPPAGQLKIDIVNVNGTGCPPGSAAVSVAPDNTAFTVSYSAYISKIGVGGEVGDSVRKNCTLIVEVKAPQGFIYAIARADFRGYLNLADGAWAQQRAHYWFQGHSQTARSDHRFTGPLDDNWQTSDVTEVAALVYEKCGEKRNFVINTELKVNKGTSNLARTTSEITMDSTDGSIDTIYHFAWKTCP